MLRFLSIALVFLLGLSACAPTNRHDDFHEQHGLILLENNGLTRDKELREYVQQVGRRIISATPAARDDWQIYVLDTPRVNAFVLEGGAIYVTRGLVMLANSEAELAAVMAHEIAHLVANHAEEREQHMQAVGRGLANDLIDGKHLIDVEAFAGGYAAFTRLQEADADRLGLLYLANAGYAAQGMADFLTAMIAHGTVEAELAGREYDPAQTDILATHPASTSRLAAVRAALPASPDGELGRDRHLDIIDGLIWGADGHNGFVRNNRWIDARTGLSFAAPTGMSLEITGLSVMATGNDGRYMHLVRSPVRGITPTDYLTDLWLPSVNTADFAGAPSAVASRSINGRQVAYVDVPLHSLQGPNNLRLAAMQSEQEILEFIMLAPQTSQGGVESLYAALHSIRIIPPAQRADLAPTRLRIVTVEQGQGVDDLAAMMRVDNSATERFLALNNLAPDAQLVPGQRLKILQ